MRQLILSMAAGALCGVTAPALGRQYSIPWHTIDAGGGVSSGGMYTLAGTIGQHDASPPSTGGGYTLVGGFWAGVALATPACPGDLDGDNDVDTTDLNILLSSFGCTGGSCPGDLDGDGDTDTTDLNILLSSFGCTP